MTRTKYGMPLVRKPSFADELPAIQRWGAFCILHAWTTRTLIQNCQRASISTILLWHHYPPSPQRPPCRFHVVFPNMRALCAFRVITVITDKCCGCCHLIDINCDLVKSTEFPHEFWNGVRRPTSVPASTHT